MYECRLKVMQSATICSIELFNLTRYSNVLLYLKVEFLVLIGMHIPQKSEHYKYILP